MRFCTVCDTILSAVTTSTSLGFQCDKCKKMYPARPEDTLRFKLVINKPSSMVQYDTFLRNAMHDNSNPREYNECPACNNAITNYVILGNDMQYVYVCKCGHRF